MEMRIKHEPSWDIEDANNRPLRILDPIKLHVLLGRYLSLVGFIVRVKLMVPLIFGAGYCDCFVEAIFFIRRKVNLAEVSANLTQSIPME